MIVVFDIGNVLLRWNPRNLYRNVFDDEERMERFLATALAMDFVSHTDIAEDFAGALEARAKSFPEFAEELRMFRPRWIETLGGPIEENVALLRRLRSSGKPVYALSNFARETFALAERHHDFLSEFDERIISGHVGVVKPDQRITKSFLSASGDSRANCCSSTTRPPTCALPKNSACQRSTLLPASIWRRSSSPAAP